MTELLARYGTPDTHRQAYASTRSERDREYDVIARITREMYAQKERKSPRNFASYVAALNRNRDLWNIFFSDVQSNRNTLPDDLKARIVYLSQFVRTYTSRVLDDDLDISPLIEINLAILKGLSSQGSSK